MDGVSVKKIVDKMKLKVLNPDVDIKSRKVTTAEVNRPALQLTGYFDYFEKSRIEIIGMVEYTYIQKLAQEEKLDVYEKFFSHNIPCVIFSRDLHPDEDLMRIATKYQTPILSTDYGTSAFMAELIYFLGEALAPCISIHGVLVDVYGEGLLIMGDRQERGCFGACPQGSSPGQRRRGRNQKDQRAYLGGNGAGYYKIFYRDARRGHYRCQDAVRRGMCQRKTEH